MSDTKSALTFKKRNSSATRSPFRYPGGKGFFGAALSSMVQESGLRTYGEPYAGGGAAALQLLEEGTVDRVLLNDGDIRIYSVWKSILTRAPDFLALLAETEASIENWHRQKQIVENPDEFSELEVGFATFFLNRTNRSGIIRGAGPIGGYAQSGKWKLDVRYPVGALAERVNWLSSNSQRIQITNLDGLEFLRKSQQDGSFSSTFWFIDPPYVTAGSRLYLNTMNEMAHRRLAHFMRSCSSRAWAMTYDDHPLIRELYSSQVVDPLNIHYSLQNKRSATEVLIRPHR